MSKEPYVTCNYCGRKVPRSKAVIIYKYPSWVPENLRDAYRGAAEKIYVCISCAKHRGMSFRNWRTKVVREERKIRESRRKKALGRKRRGKAVKKREEKGTEKNGEK